jgi:hypothetical protein
MRVRRFGWLLSSIPSVALLACFGSTDIPTGAPPPELDGSTAPSDAGFRADTTVPDASSPAPEAAVAEASADAAEEPSPPLVVTVVVVGPGGPEAGKTIVFSDATGAIVTTATTDASGTVVQALAAGSQATAVLGTADSLQLVTVVGVQPGDTLTAIDGVASQVEGDVLVTVHGSPPANTESYLVYSGPCDALLTSGPTADLDVSGCTNGAGQFPLLAVARDDNGGPLAYSFEKPNALATDGGQTSIVMTGAWNPMGTETVSVTGTVGSDDRYVSYSEVAAGVSITQTSYEPIFDDAGVQSASFASHPIYPDFVQTELSAYDSQPGVGMVTAIATRTDAPSGSASFDASDLLPIITDASIDSTDPTRPTVSWTSAAPLSGAVGTIAEMFWYDEGTGQSGSWTIVVPSSVTSVQAPLLPSGTVTSLAPDANSLWSTPPTVAAIGGGNLVDYAAFRRTAGQLATQLQPGSTPTVPPLPSDGTMKVTARYQVIDSE